MSQRECAGFNWPGFAVSAGEVVGIGPRVNLAAIAVPICCPRAMRDKTTGKVASILLPSVAQGVGHVARCTTALFNCSPFFPPPRSE